MIESDSPLETPSDSTKGGVFRQVYHTTEMRFDHAETSNAWSLMHTKLEVRYYAGSHMIRVAYVQLCRSGISFGFCSLVELQSHAVLVRETTKLKFRACYLT